MITVNVINNMANATVLRVALDGEPLDFSAVTRMVAAFEGSAETLDSDVSPTKLLWNSAGEVTLKVGLGGHAVAAGDRRLTLTAYDPAHTAGQQLISAVIHNVVMRFA